MSDAKQTYPVLGRVRHDGEAYQPGEFISLTKMQAEQLLKVKAIAAPKVDREPVNNSDDAGGADEFDLVETLRRLIAEDHEIKGMNMANVGKLLGDNARGVKRKDVDAALAVIDAQSEG